jgi:hypothetical protein
MLKTKTMKKLLILFCSLSFSVGYSQAKIYKYYVYLSDYTQAPTFTTTNGLLVYNGTKSSEATFFSGRNLTYFQAAFPDGIDLAVKNIFYLETTNTTLVADMKTTFPSLYWKSDDITDVVVTNLADYYPNDYGTSSPNPNLGFNYNRKEWDYCHLPTAWGITQGLATIKIGISDTQIYSLEPDLINKIESYDSTVALYTTLPTITYSHGLDVALTAAARGNNAYGSAGVCMNCSIVAAPQSIGSSSQTVFSNLYKISKKGAKIINMSWCNNCYTNNGINFIDAEQLVINDIVNNYRVTLVAASGNLPSFSSASSFISGSTPGVPLTPYGELFVYPALYNNVISVGSVMHDTGINTNMNYVPDSVSGYVNTAGVAVINSGIYQDQWNPNGLVLRTFTLNNKVDILAPGWKVFRNTAFITNPPYNFGYDAGTSYSSPTVAGTIGLMLSLNECLLPSETEAILKLTTKDVENLPLNQNFAGYVGAGKLEVANSVSFTNEAKKIDGNALIQNHIFNRFDFNLSKINNNLTIDNVTFKDNCKANFKARNQIRLLPGTNLKPNATGNTYLSIDPVIVTTCSPVVFPTGARFAENSNNSASTNKVVLYPNPNNGTFNLFNINSQDFGNEAIQIQVFDINGRSLYAKEIKEVDFANCEINLSNFASGIYVVKIASALHIQDIKFVKK